MTIRQDAALLRKEDFLAIENVLYEVKKEELIARQFLKPKTDYPVYAQEIGYDWYDVTGSAKILAAGASAKDVPFVGEKGGRESMVVYSIVTGIRYTKVERQAVQSRSALGKGPIINLDTTRVTTARRYVAETENKVVFTGDKEHKISGLLNHPGVSPQAVAQGAAGADAAAKRKWINKTPREKLKDLLTGKTSLEKSGIFKATVLILPPEQYLSLLEPFSDSNPMTVMSWLNSQGMFFEKILQTNQVSKEYNQIPGTVDSFCILDNRPEIMELALPSDMTLETPVYDILGTSEQVVEERTAGVILRHPAGVYIGTGI